MIKMKNINEKYKNDTNSNLKYKVYRFRHVWHLILFATYERT